VNIDRILTNLADIATNWGVKVVGVLVVLFIAWVIAGWIQLKIQGVLEKRRFDATLTRFFASLAKWSILIGALLGCLGVFGIQTASFAALIAATGLAIGLAFQGTLSNFAAGVMLLVFRPCKVGDLVHLAGKLGIVKQIELFATELASLDNRRLTIPNTAIWGSTIENLTHHETRRVDVPVGVDYSADVEKTREVLEAVVKNVEGGLQEPAPQAFLKELGGSSVDWVLRVWGPTGEYWNIHQALIRDAKKALEEAGISIPFPQMDVHLDDPVVKAFAGRSAA
jgi:small conductance mechanosensitive channel